MAGYTRNDTGNNIADGNIINASDLDGEYDAIQAAFDASTGHTHDGTTGEGAPIEVIGPTQDVVATASVLRPKTDNTVDLGTSTLEYKDLFLDGTAHIDTLDVDENATITGTLDVTGAVGIDGNFDVATNKFTVAAATGNTVIAGTLGVTGTTTLGTANATTVDTTNIEVTNIKAKDGTASATIADSTGVMTVASSVLTTTDINGGTIDGTTIGGTTPAAITGTTITGTSFASSGDMTFGDNDKAIFGAGSDLEIYHDGSNSRIVDTGTGDLSLEGANVRFRSTNGDYYAYFTSNAETSLYYNNAIKLSTTATGVDVTGTVTADGLTVDGTGTITNTSAGVATALSLKNNTAGGNNRAALDFFSANTKYVTLEGGYGAVSPQFNLKVGNPPALVMSATSGGDISFYEDTGTTPKFFWDASTERLGIGNAAPATTLDVTGTVTADAAQIGSTTADATAKITLGKTSTTIESSLPTVYCGSYVLSGSGNDAVIEATSTSGGVALRTGNPPQTRMTVASNGDIQFYEDTGTTPKLTWDASAEALGIGTSSPNENLSIRNSTGPASLSLSGLAATEGAVFTFENTAATQFTANRNNHYINFITSSGGSVSAGGYARIQVGHETAGQNGTFISLSTAPNAGALAERLRITSTGSVGIGTTAPSATLTVLGVNNAAGGIALTSSTSDATLKVARIKMQHYTNAEEPVTLMLGLANSGENTIQIGGGSGAENAATGIQFFTAANTTTTTGTERMRIDSSGNLLIGGTTAGTASAGNLVLVNGTAPTGNVTNGITLYAEDVSSSSELKVRDEAGNVTTLSPHNFDLIPEGPSEEMAWSYYSERDGKRINVDMLKAIRLLEQISGEKLVHMV